MQASGAVKLCHEVGEAVFTRDCKPIIPLDAHRLNGGGGDAFFGGDHLVHSTDALDGGIGTWRVDHGAVADDVVDDDEAAGAGEFQRPSEIIRKARFVGVDEDQVKRPAAVWRPDRPGCPSPGRESLRPTSARPARAMLARATSACFGSASRVISRPPGGQPTGKPDRAVTG